MTQQAPQKLVGALVNGLKVLRYLSNANERVGVTRIARDLELNSSTCFNILRTLVYEGLVNFHEETKTYTVSLGLVELAQGVLDKASYIRLIRPTLKDIAQKYPVTATLWQRTSGGRVVLVDRVENSSAIRVHMSVGQRLPMYIAALGRCMAAETGLSEPELKAHFDEMRWGSKPSFETFLREVKQAKEKGYALDIGNYVKGVSTVSAAILEGPGRPIMALSAVGFSAQFDEKELEELGQYMHECAVQISQALTG